MRKKTFSEVLWGGFLLLALGFAPLLHAELEGPGEEQLARFVKEKMPAFLTFRFVKTTPGKLTEKEAVVEGMLTAVSSQHLYQDMTLEAIPELASGSQLPAGLIAPAVVKKIHGSGEILEIPLQVIFKRTEEGYWSPVRLEDHRQFEQLGKPMENQKMGALIQGSGQTDRAVTQFRKEYAKAMASGTLRAKPPTSPKAVEKSAPPPTASVQQETPTPVPSEKEAVTAAPAAVGNRAEYWNVLAAACRAGNSYSGILPWAKGPTKVYLQFKGFEQNGTSISGEVVDQLHSFSRRTFTGMIRPNSSVNALFQLDLTINEPVVGTPVTGSISSTPTIKKTYVSLVLVEGGSLMGEVTTKGGTKLTQRKLEGGDYTLLFTP